MQTRLLVRAFLLLALIAAPSAPASAVVINPVVDWEYMLGPTITLPDVTATDVVVAGSALFVGQGQFGAGQQSILRRDFDGTLTTVVSNLNALGGLAYDFENDRLVFTDNGGDLMGATSGDTVYALPSPHTVAAPVDAATLTLAPSGTIPFAQAVLPLAGGTDVLVGDAAGPGLGAVVKVAGGTGSDFITGLDYVAGLSTAAAYAGPLGTVLGQAYLYVGNVDGSFAGSITRYKLDGTQPAPVNLTPMSGALDQATDTSDNLVVTGGFTNDFMSSTLVTVVQGGAVQEIASGFGFSSGVTVDGPSQRIFVLDFGLPKIDTVISTVWLNSGGRGKKECHVETWGSPYDLKLKSSAVKIPVYRWTCTDGDPGCDRDLTVDGTCTFQTGTCVHVKDYVRLPECTNVDVATVTVASKRLVASVPALQAAADAILPATTATCGAATLVPVPADRRSRTITFDAKDAAGKRLDKDTLKLRCLP